MKMETYSPCNNSSHLTTFNPQATPNFGFTQLYVWGDDSFGQLGLGHKYLSKSLSQRQLSLPKGCSFGIQILDAACGSEHAALLTRKGHLYCMGSNRCGKLGCGGAQGETLTTPKLVETLAKYEVLQVACGRDHTAAVTATGLCFTWGLGSSGQLGIEQDLISPTNELHNQVICIISQLASPTAAVSACSTPALCFNSAKTKQRQSLPPAATSTPSSSPVPLPLITMTVVSGNLYGCGSNQFGQLGLKGPETETVPKLVNAVNEEVEAASAGATHSLILTSKLNSECISEHGRIFGMGDNSLGQLGLGDSRIKGSFSPRQVPLDKAAVQVKAGHHSLCITTDGSLYFFGTSSFGTFHSPHLIIDAASSLGSSFIQNAIVDASVGESFGMARDQEGGVWVWGANEKGQLGLGAEANEQALPELNNGLKLKNVKKIVCGGHFAIAIGQDIVTKRPPEVHTQKQPITSTPPVLVETSSNIPQTAPLQPESNKSQSDIVVINTPHHKPWKGHIPAQKSQAFLFGQSSLENDQQLFSGHFDMFSESQILPTQSSIKEGYSVCQRVDAGKENRGPRGNSKGDKVNRVIKNLSKKRKRTGSSQQKLASKENNKDQKSYQITIQDCDQLNRSVEKFIGKERIYWEEMLIREKQSNKNKDQIIQQLREELEAFKSSCDSLQSQVQQLHVKKSAKKQAKSSTEDRVKELEKREEEYIFLLGVKDEEIRQLRDQLSSASEDASQLHRNEELLVAQVSQLESQVSQLETQVRQGLEQLGEKKREAEGLARENEGLRRGDQVALLKEEIGQLKQMVCEQQSTSQIFLRQAMGEKNERNSSTLSFAKQHNFMSSSFAYHSRKSNGLLKTQSFENDSSVDVSKEEDPREERKSLLSKPQFELRQRMLDVAAQKRERTPARMSEEMLDKSAQKLLKIIKTPNGKEQEGAKHPQPQVKSILLEQQQEKEDESSRLRKLFMKPALSSSLRCENQSASPAPKPREPPGTSKKNLSETSAQKVREALLQERARKQKEGAQEALYKSHDGTIGQRKREGIQEFKAKLNRLERNKSQLEDKMKEFEEKIRQSATRIHQKHP